MSKEELVQEAIEFEQTYKSFRTRNEKIIASRKAKKIILSINEFYKQTKEQTLMDVMKRIRIIKKKLETRLKGKLTA